MDEQIAALTAKYNHLKAAKDQFEYAEEDGVLKTQSWFYITGLKNNPDLTLTLRGPEHVTRLDALLASGVVLSKDVVACFTGGEYHVLLNPLSPRATMYWNREERNSPIQLHLHYYGNDVSIAVGPQPTEQPIPFLMSLARGLRIRWRNPIVAIIRGLKKPTSDTIDADIRSLLTSVLFDIEYTYGIAFETLSYDNIQVPRVLRRRSFQRPGAETIELIYRNYIPELVAYYHAGSKVDYLPFKYLCYFHVLEYFSDRSAYNVVADELRKMLLKPDFHQRMDHYVTRALQVFKKESERGVTDKIKLNRVLKQFVSPEDVKEIMQQPEMQVHFSKDITYDCSKPLTVAALDTTSDNTIYDTLTRRIYALRCSIVHSNPDFDEDKAIPFIVTGKNLEGLRMEIELLADIARLVIVKSCKQ